MASSKARFLHSLNFWLFEFGKSNIWKMFLVLVKMYFWGWCLVIMNRWIDFCLTWPGSCRQIEFALFLAFSPLPSHVLQCPNEGWKEREKELFQSKSLKNGFGAREKKNGGQHVWPSVDSNDSLWHLVIYVYSKRTIVTILNYDFKREKSCSPMRRKREPENVVRGPMSGCRW